MTGTLKDLAIVFGIGASIVGGSIGLGQQSQSIKDTKEAVVEVKKEVKDNQEINVEQTIALTEQSVLLEQVAKTLDKVVDKLDK